MSLLNTIMESEDFQNYMKENEEIFNETEEKIDNFSRTLKSFIIANPKEFIAENVDQMKKNIRVFAEVATAQYIHEVSTMAAEQIKPKSENLEEGSSGVNDYF